MGKEYQNNWNNLNYQSGRSDLNNLSNQNGQSNQNTRSIQKNQGNQSQQGGMPATTFLPQHGHYRQLRVYQVTEALYDLTYMFCKRFLGHGDRTVDQMVQAARSGKQNIAEGNQAAATSSETEIKLTNVAKASLEELLVDYEDYLRTRGLQQWDGHHPRFEAMRTYARSEEFFADYAQRSAAMNDEELANLCITLCHQAIYMLKRLIDHQQERFTTEGGIRERMTATRLQYRKAQQTEIERLQEENAALKDRIKELEERIDRKK